jgi:ubiquinone/menaquinone biosynthesis C-methylase UbiE
MRERNKERCEMVYEVMDVRDIKYPDHFFDIAIDKSTIDALLCGDDACLNVAKMMKEVQRVLKPEGYYAAISYGKPENRLYHFEREHLSL